MRRHAPETRIMFDYFHVARSVNDAVTEVRREEARRPPVVHSFRLVYPRFGFARHM